MAADSEPTPAPLAPAVRWRRRARFGAWIALLVAWVVGSAAWAMRLGGPEVNLAALRFGFVASGALALAAWVLLATTPPHARRVSPKLGKRLIVGSAALVAAALIAFTMPTLDREPLRSRADGTAWLLGSSAYGTSPTETLETIRSSGEPLMAGDPLDSVEQTLLMAVPERDVASRSGPPSQLAAVVARTAEFLLPAGSAPTDDAATRPTGDWRSAVAELPWWRRLFALRCLAAIAFVWTTIELVAWLRQREQSVWWAAIYAWPVAASAPFVGFGHLEMIGVPFLVAGLRRLETGGARRAAVCLAIAISVQPLALLALPFAGRVGGTNPHDAVRPRYRRIWLWTLATLAGLYGAAMLIGDSGKGFADATWAYLTGAEGTWRNAPLPRVLAALILDDTSPARQAWLRFLTIGLGLGGVIAAASLLWIRRAGPTTAGYALLLMSLLLAADAPPWRVVWPLALAPLLGRRGGLTAVVWAATCGLYYEHPDADVSPVSRSTLLWQYLPVYAVAALEIAFNIRRTRPGRQPAATTPTAG